MKNNLREQKAITLLALIITVIVLVILAMVSIRLVMNGGIIYRAENGTQEYTKAEEKEQIQLGYKEYQMAQFSGEIPQLKVEGATVTPKDGGGWTVTFPSGRVYDVTADGTITGGEVASNGGAFSVASLPAATPGTVTTANSKYESNGKTAVIPAGYTVSSTSAEQSIDNGLVITKDSNEWVWIPVSSSDLAAMYTEDSTGWTMSGTGVDGVDAVVTKYKSNSEIISGKTRGNPGIPCYREPDVLNNDSYDKNTTNLSNAGLGANIGEAATKLRDDYKAMIDSVKKYGGFYVGRYELSSAGTKKNQASLTNTNWYNLYKACKDIDSSGVVTAMIWGCQWDQMCKFINTLGDQVSLTDSRTYGNYNNSTSPANVSGYGSKQVTGYSDKWKANNIYDIAGNCWEWTQEADNTIRRTLRGGKYNFSGDGNPVTRLFNDNPTNANLYMSSRPVLYLK